MNRKLWYLKQINLFKNLPEKQVRFISERFSEKEYGKKQVVLEPEDHNKVFILKSGRVEIYKITLDGKRIIIDILGPGNVFGDLGVEGESENFVEATVDSLVCVMNKEEFFNMVSANQQIANVLVRELFSKITESEKQVAALASDNLATKIKDLLLRLAKKHGETVGEKVVLSTKFTHEELADMVGISRTTMTKMLGKLEAQGVIKRRGKIISFEVQKLEELGA